MFDLFAVGGYSVTHLAVKDFVAKKHTTFQNYLFFCICVTIILCYFCVSVLSVFFAIKLTTP